MAKISRSRIRLLSVAFLLIGVVALGYDVAERAPFHYPLQGWFQKRPFHLGLDLVGGTHLVYEADTSNIAGTDRTDAMEGVRDVIERRVNSLGVTEPVVQTSRVGETWRTIVELAGIQDVKKAIDLIGETPLLEFKEPNNAPPTPLTDGEKQNMAAKNSEAKNKADTVLAEIQTGTVDFLAKAKEFSEDLSTRDQGGDIGFVAEGATAFGELFASAKDAGVGKVASKIVETDEGYNIVRVEETRDEEQVRARHVLLCFDGATGCTNPVSKEEARKRIDELKLKATAENFTDIVKQNSTEPGADTSGGDLGWFSKGRMVEPFEKAVFAMKKGQISEVIETQFGFHLIWKTDERSVPSFRIRRILFRKLTEADVRPAQDPWMNTKLSGKQLEFSRLEFDQNTGSAQVGIEFNSEGATLFEQITERSIGKPIAIFLDKALISAPTVQQKISGGKAVITGSFSIDEARTLSQRLNAGALPVPITLISQTTVGPVLGKVSLEQSLRAGLMGLLLVALFMVVYYRLNGLIAVFALLLYSVFLLAIFRLVPVTLTLSGIAGFILSLGMAVDANVLVFERMKEELRIGKPLLSAIEEGFFRAWPSIRDGNMTTLISAAILFWFSSSMVRGFALVLGIGVLMSMFSALVITRQYLRLVSYWRPSPWWFGVASKKEITL